MKQICLTGALVSAAAMTAWGAAPQFWNLGAGYEATGISDNGVIVGTDTFSNQYFMWTAGGGVSLIGGVGGNDGYGGQAKISRDGSRVGGTNINSDTGKGEAAIYNVGLGTWTNLGGIGGTVDNSTSSGWGLSGDGQTLVGLGWTSGSEARAVRWTQGTGMVDMGTSSPGFASRANATNHNGTVIGGWQDNDNGRQGAVWINGAQKLLFDNNGFAVSEALAVSSDGQWVTGVAYGALSPYRYNTVTEVLEYLPMVSGDFFFPTALGTAISDDGSTIVGSVRDFGPPFGAPGFIWRDGFGAMTLNEYFDSMGVMYEDGFFFSAPLAMSGDGLTMSGYGISPTEGLVGWVVTVPTPGTALALGLGLMGTLRRRRV
ncbi:MAG: hypothetical protein JSS51_14805 [Planctomycetes bacterium]|nr:hypothetical protein [Planctomycetota bacterium]